MICAIVLAAGESRRMGAQKLLLPFGGKTVISHVVEQLLHAGLDGIYVVVGRDEERIAGELSSRPIRIVSNPDYKTGMLSSVRRGIGALPPNCAACLVALGDQPAITTDWVDQMIQVFNKGTRGIIVPCHGGKRGHPLLFSRRFHQEIMTRHDAVGLRGLLQAHPEQVLELNVTNPGVLSDMDVPADYQRELARLETANQSDDESFSGLG